MPAVKTKTNVGRKRKYPEGSVEHRCKVPPEVQEALEKYIARQTVQPEDGAVILTALRAFLVREGDLQ